jgi:outer membrane beta-barrel protein
MFKGFKTFSSLASMSAFFLISLGVSAQQMNNPADSNAGAAKAKKTKSPEKTKATAASSATPLSNQPQEGPSAASPTQTEALPPAIPFSAADVWNVDMFKQDDQKVLVIQDRKFTKAKKIELGTHLGLTKANPFYSTISYGVHGAYHLDEYFGIEGFFNGSTSQLTADAKQINEFLDKASFSSVKEYQKPTLFGGGALLWSPIYGKFAFFRRSIIHFDIFASLGLSVMKSETNHPLGKNQTHIGSLESIGMRVFLAKNWALRLETRHNVFRSYFAPSGPASNPGSPVTLWRQSFQFTAGTSYTFGGPDKNIN